MKINIFQTRKLHLPAYIMVVDHATKSVVLSVRGTFSVEDAVTDLVCDSTGVLHVLGGRGEGCVLPSLFFHW